MSAALPEMKRRWWTSDVQRQKRLIFDGFVRTHPFEPTAPELPGAVRCTMSPE